MNDEAYQGSSEIYIQRSSADNKSRSLFARVLIPCVYELSGKSCRQYVVSSAVYG